MIRIFFFLFSFVFSQYSFSQLKYVVEDFEGIADGASDLKQNGIFYFGNVQANIIKEPQKNSYSGERFLRLNKSLNKNLSKNYGGWGKGIGANVELDVNKDFLNFYVFTNDTNTITIELQEDDNNDNIFKKENDDAWFYFQKLEKKNKWELISIPLKQFKDSANGGDGVFNVSYKKGKLLSFIVSFNDKSHRNYLSWSFDFIYFSQGKLPVGTEIFFPPSASADDFCALGAWSVEGNSGNFAGISENFESIFFAQKKIAVVHFFQSFSIETQQNFYHSLERINKVLHEGYIPMITLEDHFANTKPLAKQPNLYSITEGHFDFFFKAWAKQIKELDGNILLRILHEFNGDWYPWCLVNNNQNPELLKRAYRHIHQIFREEKAVNVKFIWCPNSTSYPQESWNFIMNAFPGNEYVDFVGLDIYNGAGKGLPVWRSFRKEGIENYFMLTQNFPDKPLLICETSSRERTKIESLSSQNKDEWIKQMSEALTSDMSKIRLLVWFNEKKTYPVNSSQQSKNSFLNFIIKNNHFKNGKKEFEKLMSGN